MPNEYQEIEYLKFNKNQYIDTGVIPTNHTTEVKFDFVDYKTEVIFFTNDGYNYYHFTSYSNSYYWGRSGGIQGYGGTWSTGIHTLIYSGENNSVVLDNVTLGSGVNITSSSNLWIGKRKDGGNTYWLEGKIYYFKITNKSTGELVRNMIPCYRTSDSVLGLYDLKTNDFYPDAANSDPSFDKGKSISIVSSETQMVTNENHTLYAIWEEE